MKKKTTLVASNEFMELLLEAKIVKYMISSGIVIIVAMTSMYVTRQEPGHRGSVFEASSLCFQK